MGDTISPAAITVVKSPFQLFSAFTEQDKDKFFGRESETDLLYQSVQEANVVLLYGESGTGKTSIVQCGLLNETKHFNWTAITVRREEDINLSLFKQLQKLVDQSLLAEKQLNVSDLMQEVFLSNFQPILLIFDQFEEIFVFGNEEERNVFSNNIAKILAMRIPWKMVFVIREDFLAQLDVFEKDLPDLFKKRLRIELMDRSNCRNVIIKSCAVFNIDLAPVRRNSRGEPDTVYNGQDPDTADKIIDAVSNSKNIIHLPYMQVFMDKLWKEAWALDPAHIKIDQALVTRVGNMGDVLKGFLEEKVAGQEILSKVDTWKLLKLFVPEKGTTRKKVKLNEYTAIPFAKLLDIVSYFVEYKILTGCSEKTYELAHESLVPIIQGVKLNEIRPRLVTPTITGNPYKGLASFDQEDNYRFYGRKDAVNTLYDKISQQNLLVIVGNSGSGKSSLIKAGLLPLLEKEGYKVLASVRAGDRPLQSIKESLTETEHSPGKKFILLIDQYEELITRISERRVREAMYATIYELLESQKSGMQDHVLKIILTVRADFEPQFRIAAPLDVYWDQGKYIVPPFTREEIREVIEEPAYQAGLEFSPPSLVEKIAEEVYSSQATGLLPLMSFTLKALYDRYEASQRCDNLLMEDDYNALGGVIGGLQNRAELIYHAFKENHAAEYKKYQDIMQNIILRMIYLSTGELAGQRVLEEGLLYNFEENNKIKDEVLDKLLESHLIVTGKDNKGYVYFEPAHDVLVRSWAKIWDWIGQVGKENMFLRSRLAQAVNDYNNSSGDAKLLWDNKWLDDLLPELQSKSSWLNKREFDFVGLSLKKREESLAAAKRIEEYKERQQKMQDQFKEELIVEQKIKIKRTRTLGTIALLMLCVAVAMFLVANVQRKQVKKNLELVNIANQQNQQLNSALKNQNGILVGQAAVLKQQTDSMNKLVKRERQLSETTRIAAEKERIARAHAEDLVKKLNIEIFKSEAAAKRLRLLSDSLAKSFADEKASRSKADSINIELVRINSQLDSTLEVVKAQKEQNATQLVSLSKNLEETDIVKAYRVAELAYKKDSLNKEVAEQYRRLADNEDYYYSKQFEGDFSTISPGGEYILTSSSVNQSVKLWNGSGFRLIDSVPVKQGLLSVCFSPGSNFILMTYKNKVEISSVTDLKNLRSFLIKDNIISAKFSSDETKLLIVTDDQLQVHTYYNNKLLLLFSIMLKEKIVNAVFSEDGKRIISGGEVGAIYIWDVLTKKLLTVGIAKGMINSYISPKGNYYIIATSSGLNLYNSYGKSINLPGEFDKYGKLNSAFFSQDGQKVLLGFNTVSNRLLQQQQQQANKYFSNKTSVVLMDLDDPSSFRDLTSLIRKDDIYLLSNSYTNIVIDGDYLLIAVDQGSVRLTKLSRGIKEVLAGHEKTVRAMSVLNKGQYILTSADDNSTKVWNYGTPVNLDRAGLLPALTPEELKRYGIVK